MRELEPEYEGKVRFNVISAAETNQRTEEIAGFGFAEQRHGLVAFDKEGEAVATIPGHQFGREEIVGALTKAL